MDGTPMVGKLLSYSQANRLFTSFTIYSLLFTPEPIPSDHPMLQMENVIFASHIASCSVRAVRTLRETAATIAAMALRGEPLPNIVNGVGKST